MAEREGFEPSMEYKPHTPLAGERLQPLGHLSDVEGGEYSTTLRFIKYLLSLHFSYLNLLRQRGLLAFVFLAGYVDRFLLDEQKLL